MANTYVLIASNTLTSSAASVTFSSIPSTYTDLIVKWSARDTDTSTDRPIRVTFNGNTSTVYSYTYIFGDGSSKGSANSASNVRYALEGGSTAAGATSNTFSNGEMYIPNYTASANKPMSAFTVPETNAATFSNAGMTANALLFSSTAAITSMTLTSNVNFASGSSFFLYGIKNS